MKGSYHYVEDDTTEDALGVWADDMAAKVLAWSYKRWCFMEWLRRRKVDGAL